MSIASAIQQLQTAKAAISAAIVSKGGTVGQGDGFADFPADIGTIEGGGGGGGPRHEAFDKDTVTFVDYDGRVVDVWLLSELAAKTALPDQPSHTGLTADGWNWTLADIQTAAQRLVVGANYRSSDGKAKFILDIGNAASSRSFAFRATTVGGAISVDWGDGSAAGSITGTNQISHSYTAAGTYTVSVTAPEGVTWKPDYTWYPNDYCHGSCLVKVIGGDGMIGLGDYCFGNCRKLHTVILPTGITYVGNQTFNGNQALRALVLPKECTSIAMKGFFQCYALRTVALPKALTTIDMQGFNECRNLANIALPPQLQTIGDSAFYNSSVRFIDIPATMTTFATSAFNGCRGIEEIVIKADVLTSAQLFMTCGGVGKVVCAVNITAFGNYFLKTAQGLKELDLSHQTQVPTCGTEFLDSITDFTIKVPSALLADFQADSTWSAFADNMVGV